MAIITIMVPDFLEETDTVRFFAAKLYESGKLSLGQAAAMTRLTKQDFADILADYDVNNINYSFEEVMTDVERISK